MEYALEAIIFALASLHYISPAQSYVVNKCADLIVLI